MTNEDKRFEQLRFERKFIVIPYLIYAVIVLLLNIFYSDLKITMTFWTFLAYNVVILFIAFIKHYKRTLLLSLILTVLSGAAFFGIIYIYGINHF
ncbi:hypothetical protein ACVXZZ_10205 [Staphylococcus aureus]